MIKLANSVGNHHKARSTANLERSGRDELASAKRKLVVEALSLPEGDPRLLDGLPWQSFNHPKGENVRNYPQYENQQITAGYCGHCR